MDEYQHLRRMQKRCYRQADRLRKKGLLDEMVAYAEMHCTSIIRRLNGCRERQPHRRERGADIALNLAQPSR